VANVVDLLEKIGQDSRLKTLAGPQLERELLLAGIEPAVRAAILLQHSQRLEQLIGASKNVCCLIHAPQDETPQRDDEPQQDEKVWNGPVSAQDDAAYRVTATG
jgi:hypothetical protein